MKILILKCRLLKCGNLLSSLKFFFQSENNALNEITLKQILQASGELLKERLPAVGQPVSCGYKKRFFEFCHFLVLSIF